MSLVKILDYFHKFEYLEVPNIKSYEIDEFIRSFEKYIEIKRIKNTNLLSVKRKSLKQYVGIINYKNKIILEIPTIIPIEKILQIWILTHNNLKFDIFNELLRYDITKLSIQYLIELYIKSLGDLIKNGLNKGYINVVQDIKRVKGKINIHKTFYNNLKNLKLEINCSFKNYTEDILFNQIIKFCLLKLNYIADKEQKQKIRIFLRYFEKVSSLKRVEPNIFSRLVYHRLNKKYEIIHLLSKFIIENSFIDNREGKFYFFNFLIDINSLFERFVRKVLDKYKPVGYYVQKEEKKYNLEKYFKLKPDIIIKKNDNIALVLDCKYKRKLKREDKFQIVTYGNYFNFNKGVLIYPLNSTQIDYEFFNANPIRINQQTKEFQILIKVIDLEKLEENFLKQFADEIFKLC